MTPEQYWNLDDQHRDQKFYTAFCLLGAACNDYAIGIDLATENKLNWAATTLYYSMVHCGRLACFVALGDFPTGHKQLHQLFERGEVSSKTWMEGFLSDGSYGIERQRNFRRDEIESFFINSCDHPRDRLDQFRKWGQILSIAEDLRNDSNYERLLITHAHNHVSVTEDFERLVSGLRLASGTALTQVIPLMKISLMLLREGNTGTHS